MIHTDTIRAFLKKWETSQNIGYIPCHKRNFNGHNAFADCGDVIASSGVTIGTGLDLGQQRESDLRRMDVPAELIDQFRAYLGLKREEAVFALERAPLSIADEEREILDAAVHSDYIRRVAVLYDREASRPFETLPVEAQTVIASLFYQLGSPYGTPGYRETWKLLCACDWPGAAHELLTGFTRYTARRKDEGRLLLWLSTGRKL